MPASGVQVEALSRVAPVGLKAPARAAMLEAWPLFRAAGIAWPGHHRTYIP